MPARRKFDIEKVSAIVLESIELSLPLITTVMAVMDVSANQARYMVRAAREHGHIGNPPHVPARATVHRGSGLEKSWTTCVECLTPWPCPHAYPFGNQNKKQRGTHSDEPVAPRR